MYVYKKRQSHDVLYKCRSSFTGLEIKSLKPAGLISGSPIRSFLDPKVEQHPLTIKNITIKIIL